MCFSFPTALASYLLALSAGIFALVTRQVVLGCLIFSYAQMQLSELLIWKGIDTNNTKLNRIGTSFGKYLLATHVFAIGLGIILSIVFISKKKLKFTDFIPLVIGIIFFLFITVYYYLPGGYSNETHPAKNCKREEGCKSGDNRLLWPYPHRWYLMSYILSMIIVLIWIKPNMSKLVFFLIFTLTFVGTYVIYPKTVGSVWCWLASFISPLIVLAGWGVVRGMPNSDILT